MSMFTYLSRLLRLVIVVLFARTANDPSDDDEVSNLTRNTPTKR